ncbi:amidase [Paraconexibacter algicola]|uniref:Amidase n=1 Tax=Paraconexibacter algicola TaxID=2133960 RepID=A0A2T4UH15_9ACTN|nr:amidase [Paraconexibacter algicola]PTL58541.1 amidase [Paraconexibacter algicola]
MSELLEGGTAGLADRAAALAAGDVTSRELVQRSLDAIDGVGAQLGAFRRVRHEAALAEADAADAALARGERAPLLGVPIAVKDDTDVAGETTPFGCVGDFPVVEQDAEVVRRLRVAGAVIVGKTTTPEFGQWPFTEGPGFGVTRNPWNTDHTPGGSSGGSAAAVAAGLVPAALGSDGAGSVRIPAAWTGLVGVKPQRGRVSTWPDAEAFNGLTCNGPLARTVQDAALLLDAATGNHPRERHRPPAPAESFAAAAAREPGRLRIALSTAVPFSGPPARLDPRVREQVERLGAVLEGLGHEVTPADPSYGLVGLSFVPRSTAGVREWAGRVPDPARLDHRTRENARTGALLGGPLLWLARRAEALLRLQLGAVFRAHDVVLAPTTAQPPPAIGAIDGLSSWQTDKRMIAACPYSWPWNVVGWPGVNVPAGLVDGLPVGATLLGPACSEGRLLGLAAQLQEVERWHERRPPVFAAV